MKTARSFCLVLGTALLLSALFLVLHNLHADRQGGEQARTVLSALRGYISDQMPEAAAPAGESTLFFEDPVNSDLPVMETVEIDGQTYIGYLSIPALGLELPVMAEWSEPGLKTAPCRYTGSVYTDNLVIAAHNYTSHFGKIGTLSAGDDLFFTDVQGEIHRFHVAEIEQLPGTAVGEMQFGSVENWDLTLFTCTLNGQNRVTVRAQKQNRPS